MKCSQCGKPAIVRIKVEGSDLFLCVDCNLKFEQAESLEFDRLTRYHNQLVGQLETTMGLPQTLPRYAPSQRPSYHLGDLTLNNINIDRSSIGILNTGNIGAVDGAITVLRKHGEEDAAKAIACLTEAVVREEGVNTEQKNRILEMLSVLSGEATLPKEKRRSFAMKPLVLELATLLGGASALAQLWQQFEPLISGLFR